MFVALVFALSFMRWVGSYSKSIDPSSIRSFSVNAEGKAVSIPDIAQFTFSVINEGGLNIGTLQKSNTEKANAIIDYLKSEGVKREDIRTRDYSVQPRYQYYSCPRDGGPCPPSQIVGYTVSQTVSVKIRNFEKAGDVLAGTVQKGANSVSQLSFTIDDPTEVENQAREEAMEKARNQAEAVAKAGGFRLGKLLSVNEGSNLYKGSVERFDASAGGYGSSEALPALSIEPGSQEITVNITLRYEIE